MFTRYEDDFTDWPDRYLLIFNAIMAGDLALANRKHALLTDPADLKWLPTRDRQRRMPERAASVAPVSPLDRADLRGWQFVMGGTVLGTLSPFGFDAGMNGRYAWLQDTYDQCLQGLLRLKTLLDSAEVRPRPVSLLPDHGSRILGLAAAAVLGLPAQPFAPGRKDTVVIAYDLNLRGMTGSSRRRLPMTVRRRRSRLTSWVPTRRRARATENLPRTRSDSSPASWRPCAAPGSWVTVPA